MSTPQSPEARDTPEERDAWLHQALRHAPDAGATPPTTLRDAILAEARSAVRRRPAARLALTDRFAEFWAWLARPPVAAGFASLMAATLVGLMWWDRPMDEALPPSSSSRRAEPPRSAPAAPTVPNVAPPSETPVAGETAAVPNGHATGRVIPTAPAKTTAAPAFVTGPRKDDRRASNSPPALPGATPFPEKGESSSNTSSQNLPAATAIAKKSEPAPTPTTNATTAAADTPGPVTAQAARAAPAETARQGDASTNDAKSADALVAAPRPETLAVKPESTLRERAAAPTRDAAGSLDAGAAATPRAFAAAPAPAREQQVAPNARRASADTAAAPMADLLSSIAQDAARWSRPTASGAVVALDAPAQTWLASVEAATEGRWRTEIDRAGRADAASSADLRTLLLRRDGLAAATVRIEDGGALFAPQSGPAWFARLPADVVARLRATLPAPSR